MPGIALPSPTAQRLLGVIAQQIAAGRIRPNQPETFLAFSEALALLGEHSPSTLAGSRLSTLGLHDLHVWTEEYEELPKVTGLIVHKESRRPHDDFPEWHGHGDDPNWEAWWMEQANRAIDFDWSPYLAPAPTPATEEPTARVREGEDDVPDYRGVVTLEPAPAHIRETKITVGEILRRLAAGQSEAEIVHAFPGLSRADIRASLAYAAERETESAETAAKISRLTSFTEKWGGKFTLPQSDPDDPRMDYLLERYWRHRK